MSARWGILFQVAGLLAAALLSASEAAGGETNAAAFSETDHSDGMPCRDPDSNGAPCGDGCPCPCCPVSAQSAALLPPSTRAWLAALPAISHNFSLADVFHPSDFAHRIFHPPKHLPSNF